MSYNLKAICDEKCVNNSIPQTRQEQDNVVLHGFASRKLSTWKSEYASTGFHWKVQDGFWSILQSDGIETSLLYTKRQKCSMKNYSHEVRGIQDVQKLLEKATIVLDPKDDVLISNLVDTILNQMMIENGINLEAKDEIIKNIFTDVDARLFKNVVQGFNNTAEGEMTFEPTWLCTFCNVSQISQRIISITRLKQPTNFGVLKEEICFIIIILCPSKDKETKSGLETARTFGTLFSHADLRHDLMRANTEQVLKDLLNAFAQQLCNRPADSVVWRDEIEKEEDVINILSPGKGIFKDLRRRLPHYISDYTDGVRDARAIQKTISASTFLYFACLLPTIAFGSLNDKATHGIIDVRKGIFAQSIGLLFFAIFGGQHLNILLTTAPLCLFVKIIYGVAEHFSIIDQFPAFYCCVGLWCSFFLILCAIFNVSKIMKWSTQSSEEIFALFISVAFVVYAVRDVVSEFQQNYYAPSCASKNELEMKFLNYNGSELLIGNNSTYQVSTDEQVKCNRASSLLYIFQTLGTFWCGITLYNFKNTPFLQASKRELLSDYSLPLAVLLFSFIGSYIFQDINVKGFAFNADTPLLQLAQVQQLSSSMVFCSAILGASLCTLIFMDQNIGAAIVNNPSNQLKKGPAYHYDLVVIAIINLFCSLFTFPFLHVALPHAPLHVKNLADIEERVEHGRIIQTVVSVRETRLTGIVSHILLGLSLFLLPYPLAYIPPSVFDGLYLYMGITALQGNQLFERILLIFTEQTSYPPNHYIRRVPQRKIHEFTAAQIVLLCLLCFLGFFPYPFLKITFPFVLLLLLYVRHKVFPKFIDEKYLNVLDHSG